MRSVMQHTLELRSLSTIVAVGDRAATSAERRPDASKNSLGLAMTSEDPHIPTPRAVEDNFVDTSAREGAQLQ